MARPRFHRVRVESVTPVAADGSAVEVTCVVPDELTDAFAFTPGQHVTVRLPVDGRQIRRAYSLCSTPRELTARGRLRLGVRLVPGGTFSSHAARDLTPGDQLELLSPVGTFGVPFDPARRRRYAAVAAGSGITPVLSLVATALDTEPGSRFTVLYGNRAASSTMFADELGDLKDRHPRRLHLVHLFSREQPRAGLPRGRLDRATLDVLLPRLVRPAEVDEWFVCGPAGMVSEAAAALAGHGVDPATVRTELFHVGESPRESRTEPAGDAAEVSVVMDGRVTTVPLEPGRSVLDAVMAARPDVPYSCQTGVCGTCRARVVEGEVRMARTWALTDEDRAAGDILTCQAVPLTDRVRIDFDVL
ncbi:2Fe-2S iron-sulfur cluster binding domain-containing protein [Planomonospora sp. ID67723]|uniref:2Fe-2S iron-sulfur cluster-binding protein n=1 Tax=Planomonospora sp. ID67723 TaxID=2738134 RepID=UPI0018C36BCD|nr:2Fe-2S iron-sulfur cluster-binding protein [Planomonospora sp. ID67723]MBG0829095.1 2Fe-2S iron-sulfur cluster binding domain-containing protein [Planomonospora sp. ID67723]